MSMFQTTENGIRIKDVELVWAKTTKEFLFSNSVLIHGDSPLLVDPSASFTYFTRLASSHYVKTVLNTHFHGDHRSLNHLFKGVLFASHEADADAISDFERYAKVAVYDDKSYYLEWIKQVFKKYHIIESPVSIRLKDGDTLHTGTEKIRIIHIPGHTLGHIALFFEQADTLFISDIDLTPYGPWYVNPTSDIESFKQSIRKVRQIECQYYATSHGERIYTRDDFIKKIDRFYLAFEMRKFKIVELIKQTPMELDELCSHGIVYKRPLLADPLKAYFQFQMVNKHVDLLIRDGVLAKDDNKIVFLK